MLEMSQDPDAKKVYKNLVLVMLNDCFSLPSMGLVKLKNTYYDPSQSLKFDSCNVEMWPGFTITVVPDALDNYMTFRIGIKFGLISSKCVLEIFKERTEGLEKIDQVVYSFLRSKAVII